MVKVIQIEVIIFLFYVDDVIIIGIVFFFIRKNVKLDNLYIEISWCDNGKILKKKFDQFFSGIIIKQVKKLYIV